jgi:Protein of unknown function (DUF3775)
MPELGISIEKVCAFIEAARELAGLDLSTTGDSTASGDDSALASVVESTSGIDPRRRDLVAFVGDLDAGEQVNLLALILLGRGDFDIEEWDEALAAARDSIEDRSADFMIGDSALPGYLMEAIEAFEESCD